jgi:pyridoxine 5'-phosphate synthase PdxJ
MTDHITPHVHPSRRHLIEPDAERLAKVARQIRHALANLELRSNAPYWQGSSPSAKTSGYAVAGIPDWQLRQWLHAIEGMEDAPDAA